MGLLSIGIPIERQLGRANFLRYKEEHKAKYASFEEFIAAAFLKES